MIRASSFRGTRSQTSDGVSVSKKLAFADKVDQVHKTEEAPANWQPLLKSPTLSDTKYADPFHSTTLPQQRLAVLRYYGLLDHLPVERVDEKLRLCRAAFGGATVLATLVLEKGDVVLLGEAKATDDEVDWSSTTRNLLPAARFAEDDGESSPMLVNDVKHDRRKWLDDSMQACAFVSLSLPLPQGGESTSIIVGAVCVLSATPRVFSTAEVELLQSVSGMISRELQRHEDEARQANYTAQARCISDFLDFAIADKVPSGRSTLSRTSSAMDAVKHGQNSVKEAHRDFVDGNALVFDQAVEKMCALTPWDSALLLDLRAFVQSGQLEAKLERNGQQLGRSLLRPITVLGNYGMPEVWAKLESQETLVAIESALNQWEASNSNAGLAFHNDSLSLLLPSNSQSSLIVPISDHTGFPALLILMSNSETSAPSMESDKVFVKNIGTACLSTLLKDRAIQADSLKLAFVSQIAHESRTPLHGLSGQLELMRQKAPCAELKTAELCLVALQTVLDDALDFSRLNAVTELSPAAPAPNTDLVDLSDTVTSILKASWARKHAFSTVSSDDGEMPEKKQAELAVNSITDFAGREGGFAAMVNLGELRRILSNIIGNAFAFTVEGWIKVSMSASQEVRPDGNTMVTFVIADSGIGMSEAFINEGLIFTPFRQADSFTPGIGIGMCIVQDLIKRMRGTIDVKSTEGEGTTVTVELPLQLLNTGPAVEPIVTVLSGELGVLRKIFRQKVTHRHGYQAGVPIGLPKLSVSSKGDAESESRSRSPSPVRSLPLSAQNSQGRKRRSVTSANTANSSELLNDPSILRASVTEDNAIARSILMRLLKSKGYAARASEDGEQAVIEFCKGTFRPHVSIMDIGLPIKDGMQAAFEIREYEKAQGWERHHMIALTALESEADRRMGLEGPFDEWLTKGGKSLRVVEENLSELQRELQRGQQIILPSPQL